MRNKWTLVKCCLMLCISMILFGNMGTEAEAREAYYPRSDWHLIDRNMQPVDEIVVHEGESILFYMGELQDDGSYIPDPTYYVGGRDWHFSVYPYEEDYKEWYENENIKVWQPTVRETSHVYVKGLRATDSDDNYYLFYIDLNTRIPITVLPAEPGVTYPTYPEWPTDIYYNLEDAYEYIRHMTRNHVQENFYFYIPEELEDAYEGFEGAYGFYTSQAELDVDEGDYMDLSGFGSYGTSPDGWASYRDTDYTEIEVRRAGYIYNTTVEQERAVDAKIASLFGAGGALEYTKNLEPHEQVRACMNYIQSTVSYVSSYASIPHSAYGALIEQKATCQGYALAFYRLLRELGIPNRIVMVEDVGAHTFNLVLLNGKYYFCDSNGSAYLQGFNTFGYPVLQSKWRDDAGFQENIWNRISATDYDPSAVVLATDLTLDRTVLNFSAVGEILQVNATVTPADAVNAEISWSTSDPTVATVDANGSVTAVGDGMAGVIAKTADGRLAAVCVVVVDLPGSGEDATPTEPTEQELLVRNFVERMYTIVLGRAAEEDGLDYWSAKLIDWEIDGHKLASNFVISNEFENRGLSNEAYVSVLYQAILNRDAVESEINYYLNLLNTGLTRQDLLNSFAASAEFDDLCNRYGIRSVFTQEDRVKSFVKRMYTVALNREADEVGMNDWTAALISGKSDGSSIGNGFINSAEFVNRNLYDSQYLTVLYQTFFNREPGVEEMAYWLKLQALGASRQDLLNGFVGSPEFANLCNEYGIIAVITQEMRVKDFVERMYTVVLGRGAADSEIQYYADLLINQTLNGCQVVNNFVGSPEFTNKGLSDSDYIKTLYLAILDREAADSEVSYWQGRMAEGFSKREIMEGFLYSNEFGGLCEQYGIIRGSL